MTSSYYEPYCQHCQRIQIELPLRGGYLSTGTKNMRQQLVSNLITPFIVDLSSPKILLTSYIMHLCHYYVQHTQNFTPLFCEELHELAKLAFFFLNSASVFCASPYQCFHVPYSALTMFISSEQKERDSATAYSEYFSANSDVRRH